MASYTYKEITNALLAAGFVEQKNNNGSHQMFVNPKTGFAQPVPRHSNGMIATGTAEAVLEYVVMSAYITKTNIASDRYKLSNNVINFIKKQHAKMKEDKLKLIPYTVRKQNGIETQQDVVNFVNDKAGQAKREYKQKYNIKSRI